MTLYVSHTCRNKNCEAAFMDKDTTNAKMRSPSWKYCPACVQAGFVNPERKPLTQGQKDTIIKMHEAKKRKLARC